MPAQRPVPVARYVKNGWLKRKIKEIFVAQASTFDSPYHIYCVGLKVGYPLAGFSAPISGCLTASVFQVVTVIFSKWP
jgi:hypothetical protein